MGFRRKIGAERAALMLPFNVVLAGRVRGTADPAKVAGALEALRWRHPLLAVRVEIDNHGVGWFVGEDVPMIPTRVESRRSENQWLTSVREELRASFPLETGPLVRCVVVHSPEMSDIVLCGHHAVLDGMSLGYLLRDLLRVLSGSKESLGEQLYPPPVNGETVPSARRMRPLGRLVISRMNRSWAATDIRFDESDRRRMHRAFWARNDGLQALAWGRDMMATDALVARCRTEGVTVNAALWAAFLAAQYEVQGPGPRYRRRSGMAVNTRDRLKVPVGEAFGFYASSLTVDLPYDPGRSLWSNARRIRSRIAREVARTDLFRMLVAETIHPTLLDALYFAKYGLLDEGPPRRLLNLMGWQEVSYGYALTNVGRFEIPTDYGPLRLETVYGPVVYSDVSEKTVGVITVGGRLSCVMTFNADMVGDGTALQDAMLRHLDSAFCFPDASPMAVSRRVQKAQRGPTGCKASLRRALLDCARQGSLLGTGRALTAPATGRSFESSRASAGEDYVSLASSGHIGSPVHLVPCRTAGRMGGASLFSP